jgi:hypothetical protein
MELEYLVVGCRWADPLSLVLDMHGRCRCQDFTTNSQGKISRPGEGWMNEPVVMVRITKKIG